jgi:hypothetical protein
MAKTASKQTELDPFLQEAKEAEALGAIKTLPNFKEDQEIEYNEEPTAKVIDSPREFEMAVANAQMEGDEHIEVSERLFNHLVKKAKTPYLTYGKPGIKIFKEGTKEEIQRIEKMNAEDYGNYVGRKKLGL